jgi:hypothetical protein
MIVATLEGQNHLAAALVRDLGFARYDVEQPLYDMALTIDPYVVVGDPTIANLRAGGTLSSVIRNVPTWKAARQRWSELDRIMTNIDKALTMFNPDWRVWGLTKVTEDHPHVVVVEIDDKTQCAAVVRSSGKVVGIAGRPRSFDVDHEFPEAPIVDQEVAIVTWVRGQLALETSRKLS